MLRTLACFWLFATLLAVGQDKSFSICVAPYSTTNLPKMCIPGQLCGKGKLQLRVDNGALIDWPEKGSRMLEKLSPNRDHRIAVYVGGKAQQSFPLRKSDIDTPKLCLFISDLYRTVQLWERARCPWCTCE